MIFSKLLQLGLTMSKYVLNSMSGQTVTYYNILREAIVKRRKVFLGEKLLLSIHMGTKGKWERGKTLLGPCML